MAGEHGYDGIGNIFDFAIASVARRAEHLGNEINDLLEPVQRPEPARSRRADVTADIDETQNPIKGWRWES